jgi:hypothetical protein
VIHRMKAQAAAAPRTARESGLALGRIAAIVVIIGVVMSAGSYVLAFGDRTQEAALTAAQATITAMERKGVIVEDESIPSGIVQAPARVIPLDESTPTPVVVVEVVQVVVTATPTTAPTATPTPNVVYVDRERVVIEYVPAPVVPTVTPTPLAPGQVVICVHVAGVKQIYVGDQGLASGSCVDAGVVGAGQHHIPVKVNR